MNTPSQTLPSAAALDPSFDIVGRGMSQWKRERPDIDCSGKAIVGRILRLQDVILRSVNSALEPYGLKYQSYAVLATLRASGAPYRMSPTRLQETLLLTSGGTSNLLARLEAKGWIERRTGDRDKRGVIVELTQAGRELVDRAMERHAAVERALVEMFSNEQQDEFAGLLSQMLVLNTGQAALLSTQPDQSSGETKTTITEP